MKKALYLIVWVWKFVQSFPLLAMVTLFLGSIAFSGDVPTSFTLVFVLATVGSVFFLVGIKLTGPTESTGQSGTGCGAGTALIQMVGCVIAWVGAVLLVNTFILTCRIVV